MLNICVPKQTNGDGLYANVSLSWCLLKRVLFIHKNEKSKQLIDSNI